MRFTRITIDSLQMGGTPCIRGTRIPVASVVGMVADGMNSGEILRCYPDLELEDSRDALHLQQRPFANARIHSSAVKFLIAIMCAHFNDYWADDSER